MSNAITLEQFHRVLPLQSKKSINQTIVDSVNATLTNINADPVFMENYRDNLIGFSSVLKSGRFKMESYIDAVRYVSYKLLDDTNIGAYSKTFPARIQHFINVGTSDKDISSYVAAYNKNKLVNLIWEQSSIPFHVYNQDVRQKALEVQVDLMLTARSEKVRSDAANSVLTHLKGPEKHQIEMDVDVVVNTKSIDSLKASISALTAATVAQVASGAMTAQEAAHAKLITHDDIEDADIIE